MKKLQKYYVPTCHENCSISEYKPPIINFGAKIVLQMHHTPIVVYVYKKVAKSVLYMNQNPIFRYVHEKVVKCFTYQCS